MIDDFIRNFLVKMGMQQTLDTFNNEWYELQASNKLNEDLIGSVPDIYLRNQVHAARFRPAGAGSRALTAATRAGVGEPPQDDGDRGRADAGRRREGAGHVGQVPPRARLPPHAPPGTGSSRRHNRAKAAQALTPLSQHTPPQRVVVEKKRLMTDLKRLRQHYATYEPLLEELRGKYESAMKEKTLMRLERDRLRARATSLEGTLKTLEENEARSPTRGPTAAGSRAPASKAGGTRRSRLSVAGAASMGRDRGDIGSRAVTTASRATRTGRGALPMGAPHPDDSRLPAPEFENPFAAVEYAPTQAESFSMIKTFKGHLQGVAAVAFHPKKSIVATASDDETWKLWTCPDGELIMSGEGHEDWVAGIEFHPGGKVRLFPRPPSTCPVCLTPPPCPQMLATGSGDGTVKVWDLLSAQCRATFSEHTQAVWDVAFHHEGDFLISASMDQGCKMWDLNSGRARQTFRGHVDSVNAVCFQPFSNSICTGSGDKTVSLWDIRSGLCVQTLYGHKNACNHVAFNLRVRAASPCREPL